MGRHSGCVTNIYGLSPLALVTPGVWLQSRAGKKRMRDGTRKTDKMRDLSDSEPTFFEKLTPAAALTNHEVMVVPLPPPGRGGPRSGADPVHELQTEALAALEALEAAEDRATSAEAQLATAVEVARAAEARAEATDARLVEVLDAARAAEARAAKVEAELAEMREQQARPRGRNGA